LAMMRALYVLMLALTAAGRSLTQKLTVVR
jgi:hypothetical protein